MAQNAFTVTPPNPTPPTNLSYVGNTPPLDPAQPYVDDGIPAAIPNSRLLTPANANTINDPAGALTLFAVKVAASNTAGAPGAGVSVDHEGRGAEVPLSVLAVIRGFRMPTLMLLACRNWSRSAASSLAEMPGQMRLTASRFLPSMAAL